MEIGCPANEVEQQLKEAGENLALPSSSTKDLLDLLDKIEQLLTFVGQAPSISMQGALVPSMGALISDELIKHPDLDVKVSVASCLCEVARITAPEPPYKDAIMKDIFQLHVIAFGELSNMTGHRYYKTVHILESVALVKSCLLMLDLECDDLVLEMLEQFLSTIRTNHPHTVFSAMETIMTLVIEESDEISPELLSLLISHVKTEKQDVSPSWKLAEKVLRNCSVTLKSYSETIMKIINLDFDVYAEVVIQICQNAYDNELLTKSHKRDRGTLENGGSTKKQKYIDEQIVEAVSKNKNQLKGQETETSRRGRPKKKNYNLNQETTPNLIRSSHEDLKRTKRKPSSKKHVADGSHGKDNLKKHGEELVGHRIEVWWPLDKMYYLGVVTSYDPIVKKHKVLYTDGDDEILDLSQEKWRLISSADQDQDADMQNPVTPSTKRLKQKRKRKPDYSPMQENDGGLQKSPTPADSSKTEPKKEHTNESADTSNMEILCHVLNQNKDPVQKPDISLNLTKKAIDTMNQDYEPNPSQDLKEKRTVEEKNDELVSEI